MGSNCLYGNILQIDSRREKMHHRRSWRKWGVVVHWWIRGATEHYFSLMCSKQCVQRHFVMAVFQRNSLKNMFSHCNSKFDGELTGAGSRGAHRLNHQGKLIALHFLSPSRSTQSRQLQNKSGMWPQHVLLQYISERWCNRWCSRDSKIAKAVAFTVLGYVDVTDARITHK